MAIPIMPNDVKKVIDFMLANNIWCSIEQKEDHIFLFDFHFKNAAPEQFSIIIDPEPDNHDELVATGFGRLLNSALLPFSAAFIYDEKNCNEKSFSVGIITNSKLVRLTNYRPLVYGQALELAMEISGNIEACLNTIDD